MAALARLPDDRIRALADALDGPITDRTLDGARVREIAGARLSESDVSCILDAFCGFFAGRDGPRRMARAVDAAPLQESKKSVLKEVLKSMHEKAGAQKTARMRAVAAPGAAGRPGRRRPGARAGSRPAPGDGGAAGRVGHGPEPDRNGDNEDAYWAFVSRNSASPELRGMFVAFVHGKFQGHDRSQLDLIYRMYDRFGNVPMYVGRSSGVMDTATVTPTVLDMG